MARKKSKTRGRPSPSSAAAPEAAEQSSKHPDLTGLTTGKKVLVTLPIALYYAWVGTWGHFDFGPLMGYYNMLADAFLAGNLHIAITPDQYYLHDMIPFEGKYYLQWGPVPAVFHLVFKLFGLTLTDRVANMVTGWLCSLAFFEVVLQLRKKFFPETPRAPYVWLLYGFALATPTAMVSLRGSIYHESIAFGALFVILLFASILRYLDQPCSRWAFLAGLFVALAMGCRVSLALYGLAPGLLIVARLTTKRLALKPALSHVAVLSAPVIVVGLSLLVYNDARFGSPLDFGNRYLPDATGQAAFSLTYVPENVSQYLLAVPQFSGDYPWVAHEGVEPIEHITRTEDMSSFVLMSPFVLFGFAAIRAARSDNQELQYFTIAVLDSSTLVFVVMLCFAAASRRYMQDFVPVMMLGAAIGLAALLGSTPGLWQKFRAAGWAVVVASTMLHAHLSFTQGFVWDPPDPSVVKTLVAWTPTIMRISPGPELAERAAKAGNDLGTLYLRQGDIQAAYEQFEQAAELMPDSEIIQRNLEMTRLRLQVGGR